MNIQAKKQLNREKPGNSIQVSPLAITPLRLVNTFICRHADGEEAGMDHMKLQKLAYFFHGWWLAYHEHALLTERPQVWKYGPVFPSLYNELKLYGTKLLREPVRRNPFSEPEIISSTQENDEPLELVDWVWKRYGHLSAVALSNLTHEMGTAWRSVAEERNFVVPVGYTLDDSRVRAEFTARRAEL